MMPVRSVTLGTIISLQPKLGKESSDLMYKFFI